MSSSIPSFPRGLSFGQLSCHLPIPSLVFSTGCHGVIGSDDLLPRALVHVKGQEFSRFLLPPSPYLFGRPPGRSSTTVVVVVVSPSSDAFKSPSYAQERFGGSSFLIRMRLQGQLDKGSFHPIRRTVGGNSQGVIRRWMLGHGTVMARVMKITSSFLRDGTRSQRTVVVRIRPSWDGIVSGAYNSGPPC